METKMADDVGADDEVGVEKEVDTEAAAPETTETSEAEEDTGADPDTTEESEADPEEGAGEEADAEEAPAEKPSKRTASDTIRALKAERKIDRLEREKERDQLIADRATLAAQLDHFRNQQAATRTEVQRREEEQRLSLLDPSERALYETRQRMQDLEHRLNQSEARRQDDSDRATFHAKAAHDEVYAKYADEIEQIYQDGLKKGVAAPREDLLAWKLGKELLKDKNQKAAKKKEVAGKRIDTVTSSAITAKSDVAGSKKGRTEEDRLRGVLI